jgi:alkyl sulfatase BDS1-like metallo-beta-lactamase superfamily hydrolase
MTHAQNQSGNPAVIPPEVGDVADGVRICGGLGNALSVDLGDAILQLDSGASPQMAAAMLADLRTWRPDLPVSHLVYSHGHIGYNVGASTWLTSANAPAAPPPIVVAQQNVPGFIAAIQRFEGLAHLNLWIEFAIPDASPPIEVVEPTLTFDQRLTIRGATREVELLAIPSETPDALAVWIPDVGVLHGGAAVTPTLPNSGEPTVVGADLDTWADSLERMDALGASRMVRGFGGTVDGAAAVHDVLSTMAAGLRWVTDTVADRMNQGWSRREILTTDLHFPEAIFGKDYMHDAHGARTLLLHAAWESFGGWWDRNPTSLRPAPLAAAAGAVLSAVEPDTVLATARALQAAGQTQLALHVVDLVALADPAAHPAVAEARALKADLCTQRMAECDDCWPIQQAFRAAGQVLRGEIDFHTGIV